MTHKSNSRQFVFIDEDRVPSGALTWENQVGRRRAMIAWRRAVMQFAGKKSRVVKIGWYLQGLFASSQGGFSYVSDSRIAKETGIDDAHIAATLSELEKAGFLIRRHIRRGDKTQRRIWPAHPTAVTAVGSLPLSRLKPYRRNGGTGVDRNNTAPMSSTRFAAAREAESRLAREIEAARAVEARRALHAEDGTAADGSTARLREGVVG